MSDEMVYIIGIWFTIIVSFSFLILLTAIVSKYSIDATKYFVGMLGGWKVFFEFQKWNTARVKSERENAKKECKDE